jgi:hypothetical protein
MYGHNSRPASTFVTAPQLGGPRPRQASRSALLFDISAGMIVGGLRVEKGSSQDISSDMI